MGLFRGPLSIEQLEEHFIDFAGKEIRYGEVSISLRRSAIFNISIDNYKDINSRSTVDVRNHEFSFITYDINDEYLKEDSEITSFCLLPTTK